MTAEFKKGQKETDNPLQQIPKQPNNGSKPIEIQKKPECEKKHITRDGKRRTPGVS